MTMPIIKLLWTDTNSNTGVAGDINEDGFRVYRDTATMDTSNNGANMPAPIASIPANSVEYEDATVAAGENYFYIVSAVKGPVEKFGPELNAIASSYVGVQQTINFSGTNFIVHSFYLTGTFTLPTTKNVEHLIVGGGGAGGAHNTYGSTNGGGGGGGGQVLTGSGTIQAGTYGIVVGDGGLAINSILSNGEQSSFNNIISIGGGGGGTPVDTLGGHPNGRNGGNGGGGSGTRFVQSIGGIGVVGGFNGGIGFRDSNSASNTAGGGGGGGANENGTDGVRYIGGKGGDGIQSNISGSLKYYGGGGGGGGPNNSGTIGLGGLGGGADGVIGYNSIENPGTPNTGGGGGGGHNPAPTFTGTGGSGIVILKYAP